MENHGRPALWPLYRGSRRPAADRLLRRERGWDADGAAACRRPADALGGPPRERLVPVADPADRRLQAPRPGARQSGRRAPGMPADRLAGHFLCRVLAAAVAVRAGRGDPRVRYGGAPPPGAPAIPPAWEGPP